MDAQMTMDLDQIIAANKKQNQKRTPNKRSVTATRSSRNSTGSRSTRNNGYSTGGGNAGGALISPSAAKRERDQLIANTGANKISINNLHFGVTESDIAELFGRVGRVKKVQLFYDAKGQSMGTASIIFISKEDAMAAIKKFNGITLDGRIMQIEAVVPPSTLDAATKAVLSATRKPNLGSGGAGSSTRSGGAVGKQPTRSSTRRSNQGRAGTSAGRGKREVPKTQEELDRELLDYMGDSTGQQTVAAAADVSNAMQVD